MDYLGIIKKAYEIASRRKYLWIFGILAGGAIGGGWNFSMPSTSSSFDEGKIENFFNRFNFETFIDHYWGIIFAIIGLILLLGLLWFVFSLISQGALLGSVRAISNNEENNFRTGLVFGWHKFWKVLAVGLLIGLIVLTSLAILALPVILLVLAKIYALAIIYGVLIFLADLVCWIYLGLVQPYILRLAILGQRGSWRAIGESLLFFKENWKEIVVMYLLVLAIGIGVAIGLLLIMLFVGGLLFAIGFAIYLASHWACWIYAGLSGLALVSFFLILNGIVSSFYSAIFTLTYLELDKKPRS